jgi:hypothetical protein
MQNPSSLTDCGLPGIKQIPYGVHMCHFYADRAELVSALVPYFTAGLRNNERCIWIAAEPLGAADATEELQKAGFDAAAAIRKGALAIRDFSDWYAQAEVLRGNQVVELWLDEERRALADGYAGLRITGNVTFLNAETWPLFMEYEQAVNKALHGRRIVTLCTYRLGQCGPAEVLEVVSRHNCALERPDKGWQIVTGASPAPPGY